MIKLLFGRKMIVLSCFFFSFLNDELGRKETEVVICNYDKIGIY